MDDHQRLFQLQDRAIDRQEAAIVELFKNQKHLETATALQQQSIDQLQSSLNRLNTKLESIAEKQQSYDRLRAKITGIVLVLSALGVALWESLWHLVIK